MLVCYQITLTIFIVIVNKNKSTYNPLPKLFIKKNGIVFNSNLKHRIFIGDCKYLCINNKVFIRFPSRLVSLINVRNVYFNKGYLYFKSIGVTKLCGDFVNIYKYFNIEISSTKFNLEEEKQKALLTLLNNRLEPTKEYKRYLSILKNILNIEIVDKLTVRQNKYSLPFTLIYKANGKTKRLNIN